MKQIHLEKAAKKHTLLNQNSFGMTATINDRKYELIEKITSLKNENDIAELEAHLQYLDMNARFPGMFRPMISDISVETLRKEHNYDVLPVEEINSIIDDLDIQEDLEYLLAQLS